MSGFEIEPTSLTFDGVPVDGVTHIRTESDTVLEGEVIDRRTVTLTLRFDPRGFVGAMDTARNELSRASKILAQFARAFHEAIHMRRVKGCATCYPRLARRRNRHAGPPPAPHTADYRRKTRGRNRRR